MDVESVGTPSRRQRSISAVNCQAGGTHRRAIEKPRAQAQQDELACTTCGPAPANRALLARESAKRRPRAVAGAGRPAPKSTASRCNTESQRTRPEAERVLSGSPSTSVWLTCQVSAAPAERQRGRRLLQTRVGQRSREEGAAHAARQEANPSRPRAWALPRRCQALFPSQLLVRNRKRR